MQCSSVVHIEFDAGVEFLVSAVEMRHEVRNMSKCGDIDESHLLRNISQIQGEGIIFCGKQKLTTLR